MKNSLFLLGGIFALASFASATDIDQAPIEYSKGSPTNAVSRLEEQLREKPNLLKYDSEHGYLPSLLSALKVPVSSQVLVFSKTSLQRHRITPQTPRAIYFNDEITVGFCQKGDVLEITAADPKLSTVFYTLEQNPEKPISISRQGESCLICHASSKNQGFPGHLARSVSADRRGELVLSRGTKSVNQTTPLEDRWGGWYVTGTSGKQIHLGNQIVGGWPWARQNDPPASTNVTSLKPYLTVANYLSEHSDLVALMVLEHQGEMQNRLGRANFLTRIALHEQDELNKAFGEPKNYRSDSIQKRIEWACEPAVEYMLFVDEAPLTEEIAGTSSYAGDFAKLGPFDSQKRSLRDFDLQTRIFRYPLSYLIYSAQFDALPMQAKTRIYQRLWDILNGDDLSPKYSHLTKPIRQAILTILRETKQDLPKYWRL